MACGDGRLDLIRPGPPAPQGQGVGAGRVGTAQEFASLACFLASDAAAYITGTAINVDGGRSPVV